MTRKIFLAGVYRTKNGYYTYGLVEAYLYGDSIPAETHRFTPGGAPCAAPEEARNLIGFLL